MLNGNIDYAFWQWFYSGSPLPHWGWIVIVSLGMIIVGLWPDKNSTRSR